MGSSDEGRGNSKKGDEEVDAIKYEVQTLNFTRGRKRYQIIYTYDGSLYYPMREEIYKTKEEATQRIKEMVL